MNDNEASMMMSGVLQQVVRGLTGIEEICKSAAEIKGLSDTVRVPVALVDPIAIPTPGVITVPGDEPEIEIPTIFAGPAIRVDVTDPLTAPRVEDPEEAGVTQEQVDASAASFKEKLGGRSLFVYFQEVKGDNEPINGLGSALVGREVRGLIALSWA